MSIESFRIANTLLQIFNILVLHGSNIEVFDGEEGATHVHMRFIHFTTV